MYMYVTNTTKETNTKTYDKNSSKILFYCNFFFFILVNIIIVSCGGSMLVTYFTIKYVTRIIFPFIFALSINLLYDGCWHSQ